MYIISLTYKVPLDVVDQYIEPHIEYLKNQYNLGHFIASGRKVPRTGGIILSIIKDIETLKDIIATDPFIINDIADVEITEFIPSMASQEMKSAMFK